MKNRFSNAVSYVSNLVKKTSLFKNLWSEGTCVLLHSPRGTGKTALAVDIAKDLTDKGSEVFYLTTQDFDSSVVERIAGNERLYIHKPSFSSPDDPADYADIVIADLEEAIAETGAKIFIVDFLTRIAALSFGRNASPAYVMKRLVALQVRHNISLLVVARDSTRAAGRALLNLADSEITIYDESTETAESKETAENATEKPENKTPKTEKTAPVSEKPAPETHREETPCDYSMFNHYSPWWDDAVRE